MGGTGCIKKVVGCSVFTRTSFTRVPRLLKRVIFDFCEGPRHHLLVPSQVLRGDAPRLGSSVPLRGEGRLGVFKNE